MFYFPFANRIILPCLKLTIFFVVDWSDKDQGYVLPSQIAWSPRKVAKLTNLKSLLNSFWCKCQQRSEGHLLFSFFQYYPCRRNISKQFSQSATETEESFLCKTLLNWSPIQMQPLLIKDENISRFWLAASSAVQMQHQCKKCNTNVNYPW